MTHLQVENATLESDPIITVILKFINNAQLDDFPAKSLLDPFLDQIIVFNFVIFKL